MNFLFFILFIMILLGVAFFTLFERKFLSYLQFRKGPNKVYFMGLLQPVSDGLKLFMKGDFYLFVSSKYLFMGFPFFMLFMMFMFWGIFIYFQLEVLLYSLIYFMLLSSLSVYGVLGAGWVSNSKFGVLGSYRSVAQVISYEVSMIFILMIMMTFNGNYSLSSVFSVSALMHSKVFGMWSVWLVWVVVIIAELNRAPFDFSESESELVSGFNVEYGGAKFAFMFLGEYGNMLFMCYLTMFMFHYFNYIYLIFYVIFIVWVRGVFPRYRYDNLMYLNWLFYLPFVMIFYMSMYMYMYIVM